MIILAKKNPFYYARGLAPSPKILTKVIRINSFRGKIFSHAQYLLSKWNNLKFLLAILLIMCTTAQNHENIHILFIYPSIDRLIKKNLGCPVQRTKTVVSKLTKFTLFLSRKHLRILIRIQDPDPVNSTSDPLDSSFVTWPPL